MVCWSWRHHHTIKSWVFHHRHDCGPSIVMFHHRNQHPQFWGVCWWLSQRNRLVAPFLVDPNRQDVAVLSFIIWFLKSWGIPKVTMRSPWLFHVQYEVITGCEICCKGVAWPGPTRGSSRRDQVPQPGEFWWHGTLVKHPVNWLGKSTGNHRFSKDCLGGSCNFSLKPIRWWL